MDSHHPERWYEIDRLFEAVLDIPRAERLPYLTKACGGDRDLLESVQSLLAKVAEAERQIGESATRYAEELLPSLLSEIESEGRAEGVVGQLVGPYRLLDELGRGGMGAVFLAERADGEFRQARRDQTRQARYGYGRDPAALPSRTSDPGVVGAPEYRLPLRRGRQR